MRILFAGATGVLGRATLPHLREHEVTGLTRSPEKLELLQELGAEGVVCDAYDAEALVRLAQRVRPEIVVNFLTDLRDLSPESLAANSRVRREGGPNVRAAAEAAGARRLVVESVAFPLTGEGAEAVEQLEEATHGYPGEGLVLRFGYLWGPGTFSERPSQAPAAQVEEAGAEAARLLAQAPPGTYVVTDREPGRPAASTPRAR